MKFQKTFAQRLLFFIKSFNLHILFFAVYVAQRTSALDNQAWEYFGFCSWQSYTYIFKMSLFVLLQDYLHVFDEIGSTLFKLRCFDMENYWATITVIKGSSTFLRLGLYILGFLKFCAVPRPIILLSDFIFLCKQRRSGVLDGIIKETWLLRGENVCVRWICFYVLLFWTFIYSKQVFRLVEIGKYANSIKIIQATWVFE